MTTSSGFNEALDGDGSKPGNDFSGRTRPDDIFRSMRVLERLALTLGVPVETFFDQGTRSPASRESTAQDVADLTQAFMAITDPAMRRYCLDVVRAAGSGRRLIAAEVV